MRPQPSTFAQLSNLLKTTYRSAGRFIGPVEHKATVMMPQRLRSPIQFLPLLSVILRGPPVATGTVLVVHRQCASALFVAVSDADLSQFFAAPLLCLPSAQVRASAAKAFQTIALSSPLMHHPGTGSVAAFVDAFSAACVLFGGLVYSIYWDLLFVDCVSMAQHPATLKLNRDAARQY